MIFANDGDDIARLGSEVTEAALANEDELGRKTTDVYPISAEGLLEVRTTALLGSHVDAIWYYSTWGMKLHHSGGPFGTLYSVPEPEIYRSSPDNYRKLLAATGKDSLDVMIDACHSRGMECFYENRMNDIHDSFTPAILHHLRRQHPEWLMWTQEEGMKYSYPDIRCAWSAWNFEVPEVRQLNVDAMREVCQTYDIDGIDLDFIRHIIYFPESMRFEPVKQTNADLMTDMVRGIRKATEEEGLRRGRPILLGARVPEDETLALGTGLDVRAWLDEGLVDVLVTGSWMDFTLPRGDLNKLAHSHDVPVYPMMNSHYKGKDYHYPSDENLFSDLAVWRGDALNFYAEGADGMYLMNVFDPTLRQWRELGDPKSLLAMDRTYVWDYLPSQRKETDVYVKLRLTRWRRPVEVTENGCEPMPLYVGETLSAGTSAGLALRVHASELMASHGLAIEVNGKPAGEAKLSEALGDSPKDVWLEFAPDARLFGKGENLVTAKVIGRSSGYPKIDQVRLNVGVADATR